MQHLILLLEDNKASIGTEFSMVSYHNSNKDGGLFAHQPDQTSIKIVVFKKNSIGYFIIGIQYGLTS